MGGGSRLGHSMPICVLRAPKTNHLNQMPRGKPCKYQNAWLLVLHTAANLYSWLALALQAEYTANKFQSLECHPAIGSLVDCSCMVAMPVPCLMPPESSIPDLTWWLNLRPASFLQTWWAFTGFLADPRILIIITGVVSSSCLDWWDCALVNEGVTPICLTMALKSPSFMEQPAFLAPQNGQKKNPTTDF